jgi:hypothetical protein
MLSGFALCFSAIDDDPCKLLTLFNSPEIDFVALKLIIFWEFSIFRFFLRVGPREVQRFQVLSKSICWCGFWLRDLLLLFFLCFKVFEKLRVFFRVFFFGGGFVYKGWARFFPQNSPTVKMSVVWDWVGDWTKRKEARLLRPRCWLSLRRLQVLRYSRF